MKRPATTLIPLTAAALALGLTACGGAHPRAAAPSTQAPKASAPAEAATAEVEVKKVATTKGAAASTRPHDDHLPPGVLRLDPEDRRDPNAGRVRVAPASLELSSLPIVEVPGPLEPEDAPDALPPSKGEVNLKIEKIDSGWRARGAEGSAVYVVLDDQLGRLQIGAIAPDRNATDRVYRTCGDRYYQKATLTPARWQTLTRKGGVTKLTIVDAWFDARSCEASVVRTTQVSPKPLLGYMLYGYRSPCTSCGAGERVTFIAPPLGQVAADGIGGKATVSHGSFTLVELPLRRGGAASFTGQVPAHAMKTWAEALGVDEATTGDVLMGAELQQAVGDERPVGIAYATLLAR